MDLFPAVCLLSVFVAWIGLTCPSAMVDAVHGPDVARAFNIAQAAVTSYTSAILERLERAVDVDEEREDVVDVVYALLVLGLDRKWADFTHVALFCSAFESPSDGVGLLCRQDSDLVHIVCGDTKRVLTSVLRLSRPSVIVSDGGSTVDWDFVDDAKIVRGYLARRRQSSHMCPSVSSPDRMHILWVEGNPLQLLLDALRTNLGIVEEVARVLPVPLVPELVAEFHLCSGLDAIKPRFTAPKRKRLADTPLGRAFAKASNVQTTYGSPGRELDPRDGHGS
jgi:hypothetical protein